LSIDAQAATGMGRWITEHAQAKPSTPSGSSERVWPVWARRVPCDSVSVRVDSAA
jgi:hypothetical protein